MNHLNYTTNRRHFKQLNFKNRIEIETLLKQGFNQSQIAKHLGVDRSTISREINRGSVTTMNSHLDYSTNYEADTAQNLSNKRNLNSRKKPKYLGNKDILNQISKIVKEKKYSFEIISGRLKLVNSKITFSTQTLYNYYHKGLLDISNFHLPNYGISKSSKRARRANLAHKSIDLRPKEVNERTEAMHWEMDCVVGGLTKGPVLLVLSERVTRTELIFKMETKTAANVVAVLDYLHDSLGSEFNTVFKSITTDNGSEFQDYEGIENDGRTIQFFAHPYSSWERGTNENLNREIRRFFPKKTKFNNVTEKQIKRVQRWMNNKPRKVLNFQTPIEVLRKHHPKFAEILSA